MIKTVEIQKVAQHQHDAYIAGLVSEMLSIYLAEGWDEQHACEFTVKDVLKHLMERDALLQKAGN